MRHNALKRTGPRVGKSKLTQCPECAVAKIAMLLGTRKMREHRYEKHGYNFRAGRVVNKGVMGRPRKTK